MSDDQKIKQDFEALLDFISRSRGFNFNAYKRSTLTRRIKRRMQMVGINDYQDYMDYLETNPDDYTKLFNTILINVTDFFRDPEAWEYLAADILPQVTSKKSPEKPLRFWCAGCASGEETYSLAMLLAEALGEEEFRRRVKIYATDVDEVDLNHARLASYASKEIEGIPPRLLEKYFEKTGDHYAFRKDLRRSIIFGRNNLIQDAPISRIDLIVCRNTLMYFNAEAQEKILGRLHFALNDDGFIFLGKAEMLLAYNNLFSPVNLKWRVFAKVPKANFRDRLSFMGQTGNEDVVNHLISQIRLRDAAFDSALLPQIVIDLDDTLVLANDSARSMFGISQSDIGRLFHELQISSQPVELRSRIQQVTNDRTPVFIKDVVWKSGSNDNLFLDIQVFPLFDNGKVLGASVTFMDVTSQRPLQQELDVKNNELETALEELQSTNEELETLNEELQSTNEELETMNEELNRSSYEFNEANAFLDSILASFRVGIIVVDPEFCIQAWNDSATDLWGFRPDEVLDQNLLKLDIDLPVERLKRPALRCLSGESFDEELSLEATNRRGKLIQCKVGFTPLLNNSGMVKGVILTMQEEASGR